MQRPATVALPLNMQAGVELLRDRDCALIWYEDELPDLFDVDAVIADDLAGFDEFTLGRAPQLTVVALRRPAPPNEHLAERGIRVLAAPVRSPWAIAEYALGLIFASVQRTAAVARDVSFGRWPQDSCSNEVAGKTLGLLGFDRCAFELGHRARQLGLCVYAYGGRVGEHFLQAASPEELVAASDIVSVHNGAPMVDRELLACFKQGAALVAVSEWEFDETALQHALDLGVLSALAADWLPQNPYSGVLLQTPNVLLTPRLAGQTHEWMATAERIACVQLLAQIDEQGE